MSQCGMFLLLILIWSFLEHYMIVGRLLNRMCTFVDSEYTVNYSESSLQEATGNPIERFVRIVLGSCSYMPTCVIIQLGDAE